jgi:hypothetical protein
MIGRPRSKGRGPLFGLWACALALGLPPALACGQTAPQTTPARPAQYVAIVQSIHVDRPVDAVWSRVGGYCDIKNWLKTSCVYTSGAGDIGTNRLVAGRINEVMVARTSTSYTYAQPMAPDLYHGTVEIVPDQGGSKIVYTIFYDVAGLPDPEARAADEARRAKMFMGALSLMKAFSEAP